MYISLCFAPQNISLSRIHKYLQMIFKYRTGTAYSIVRRFLTQKSRVVHKLKENSDLSHDSQFWLPCYYELRMVLIVHLAKSKF